MTLTVFFRALPMALPLILVAVVVASIACRPAGKRIGCGTLPAWFLIASIGAFAALTLTPTESSLLGYSGGSTSVALGIEWSDLRSLTSVSSESLNLVAGAILGIGATFAAVQPRRWSLVIGAIVAPIVAELVQWAVPALGRAGFLMTDVVINWFGVALGCLVAYAAANLIPNRISQHTEASTSEAGSRRR